MDRRNGGDPLAPPRPPKLLPRVHRPRAPEPTALSSDNNNSSSTSSNISNINQQHPSITAASATTSNNLNNLNNLNNNLNNNNNIISIIPATADIDDYQIHHLTFLPQRPSSLSRNSSNASSSTATANSSNGSTSSFTRRRPPAPTPTLLNISTAATTTATSNSNNSSYNSNISNNSNFLSHFQSAEPALALTLTGQPPASPVTLAQPRPECERLTNEYVDTPLQHATRSQHPAGQQDNGQTTTHHLLLLPQRQQHQHQQQTASATHSIGNNRLAATAAAAGSAAAAATTTTVDGTDGLLHSTHLHTIPPAQQQHHQHPHHQQHHHLHTHLLNGQTKAPASNKFASQAPPAPPRNGLSFAAAATTAAAAAATATATTQPITQAITKQPSNNSNSNSNSSKEHMHALEELLQQQQHHQQQQHQQLPGSGGQLGASIVLGGDPSLLNPIVCPRCGHCRCEQCQSPRPLPQTWVCNKTCLCSAESIIDYASCLCCAKALFYHCARDNDMDCDDGTGTPCVDNPCSCGPYKRTQRWGWLGALSIVLPCLWCYWPMRGCIKLCEKCYARFAGRGCRCQLGGGVGTGIAGNGLGGNSMLPIVPLGGNANSLTGGVANGAQNGGMPLSVGKGFEHGCSAASRILRKGDLTPEKRLLDSSPDY